MKKAGVYLFILIILLTGIFGSSTTIEAHEKKLVRVGYYLTDAYQDIDEDGYYSGYGYEYYKQVAQYANWDLEFVVAPFLECLQMLRDGEIDIINGVAYNEERMSYLNYSDYSISNSAYELYITRDNENIYYEDYESFDGMRVAVLKGNMQVAMLEEYEAKNNFSTEKVEYSVQLEMEQALENGEVDAVYSSHISDLENNKIVAKFTPINLYFAVNKQREDILEELNKAIWQLRDNNPSFELYLQEKYQKSIQTYNAAYTKAEREFIKSKTKVYVKVTENWQPFIAYDGKRDAYTGIVTDVLKKIEGVSGLSFTYIDEDELKALQEENPDAVNNVVSITSNDFNWADKNSMELSTVFLDSPVVMVERTGAAVGDMENTEIALPENACTSWLLERQKIPGHITYYKDNQECLDAVNSGKADCTYVNTYVANFYLSQLEYGNLYTVNLTNFSENLAIGIAKEADSGLFTIINKSLMCISQDELQTMILQNMNYSKPLTMRGIMTNSPQLIIGGAVFAVLLVGLFVIYMYMVNMKKRELIRSLELEEHANESKSTFLATMSHEIRTPLNAVIGYISMAQENEDDVNRVRDYHVKAQAAAKHLLSVINDVLDISSISNGKLMISREAFDMKELINGLNAMFYQQAREKGVGFQVDISGLTHEYIVGDKLRINQILLNLLSNAVKFTGTDGKISLVIAQKQNEEEMLMTQFTVRDTGVGMTPEYLNRIFTPFEQQDATITRKYGGTGLGLSITSQLVELMEGTITVESKEGEGSVFTVTIPTEAVGGSSEVTLNPGIGKIRVLIVDDNEDNCAYAKALLKRLGIKGDIVHDGESAIRQLQKRKGTNYEYELCLMDWQMEGLDGVETTRRIREEYEGNLQIIILTAYDLSMVTERAKAAGADMVITKPLFQSVILDILVNKYGNIAPNEDVTRDFSGLTVMLVEDNEMNMEISEDILRKANLNVIKAVNGKEAVDTFLQSTPGEIHAILMDIQMPVMGGYEAAEVIRKSSHADAKTVPIIALTANAFAEDIQKALDAGMNGHIAKPISKKGLFALLDKVLH